MLFSILLPTLGLRYKETERLFASLSNQELKDFEIVMVSQINHEDMVQLVEKWSLLKIKHIRIQEIGLSNARNIGLKQCQGEWVIISDDDCWYTQNSLADLAKHIKESNADIVLSQIYDPISQQLYKSYQNKRLTIKNKFALLSRSSIEIAFNRQKIKHDFDVNFGLGARYICCEEVDFLLNNYNKNKVISLPIVSVYHEKKNSANSGQIIAKGALYNKNFNIIVSIMILVRDLIIKRENNFKYFIIGYKDYEGLRK